jgi:hypothetical protein
MELPSLDSSAVTPMSGTCPASQLLSFLTNSFSYEQELGLSWPGTFYPPTIASNIWVYMPTPPHHTILFCFIYLFFGTPG